MKLLTKSAWLFVAAFATAVTAGSGQSLKGAETNTPALAVGVYDSRVIAYAHFWSATHQREIADLSAAARSAKAAGQTARFNELEAALKSEQEKIHLQVFSTAPAPEAMAELKDRLPAIQKEAGVAALVSKWDEPAMKEYKRARQVDVTDRLLREFKLDAKRTNVARDLGRKKPLPLEKARESMREGKL